MESLTKEIALYEKEGRKIENIRLNKEKPKSQRRRK